MSSDPLFGLRIRRQPPQREGQTRRSTARVPKKFEECLKRSNLITDSDPSSGVLRQNSADHGSEPPPLEVSATPSLTPSLQNRQETALKGGDDSQRPDTGASQLSRAFNASLMPQRSTGIGASAKGSEK